MPLEGDLEARPRELEADLGVRLCRDTTLVLDLRGATFLGAGAARLLLDLRSQAVAAGVRLVLWRPEGQPFRTLRSCVSTTSSNSARRRGAPCGPGTGPWPSRSGG